MIERKFVAQKIKEFQIEEYITQTLKNVGHSHTKMIKTPLGEKIIIYTSRPGLIVGRKGQNIKHLTKMLKRRFGLENPQVEISEVGNPSLDAKIITEKIVDALEKFGSQKFKAIGHKIMTEVMRAGALGIEIVISGKVPSARAKSWRFYQGYLKKCGDIANSVRKTDAQAHLKTGVIGVKVSIMPPDIKSPDDIEIIDRKETIVEELNQGEKEIPDNKSEHTQKESDVQKAPEGAVKSATEKPKKRKKRKNESEGTKTNE